MFIVVVVPEASVSVPGPSKMTLAPIEAPAPVTVSTAVPPSVVDAASLRLLTVEANEPSATEPTVNAPALKLTVGCTLAVSGNAVWALSSLGLVRVDPAHDRVVATAPDPDLRRARLVAAGGGAVWAAGWSSVSRVDPALVTP